MKKLSAILVLAVAIFAAGCHGLAVRAKGGKITHGNATSPVLAEVQQPENPKDSATQDVHVEDEKTFVIPAGSKVEQRAVEKSAVTGEWQTNLLTFYAASNIVVSQRHKEDSAAKVGASQLDIVGETIAKLKSTKWWSVFGFVLFVGGVFACLYPPAVTVLGGIMPGAGIALSGLVIAVLPILLVGHETLIIVGASIALVVAGAIWFAHKHGGIIAELKALKANV